MPKGKNVSSKKGAPKKEIKKVTKATGAEGVEEADEEDAAGDEIFTGKEKVPLVPEIEERDDHVAPVDKMIADPLLEAESVSIDGNDHDDAGLDEEELDPFGDKWEA